jgi:hypothetical protein
MLSMIELKPTFSYNKEIKEYILKCQNDYMKRIVQENKDEYNKKDENNKNNKKDKKDKYNKSCLDLNKLDSFKEFDEYLELQKEIPDTNPNNFSINPILFFLSISSIFFIYSTRK